VLYALCFKKTNSHEIFIQILQEVHELKKPTLRYWGKDKQYVFTIVILDMVSQDYPERCYDTGMSNLGVYTHRSGHSCKYDDVVTPSCVKCEWNRIEHIVNQNDGQIDACSNCSDWWDVSRNNVYGRETKYPLSPSQAIEQSRTSKSIDESRLIVPSVEITFEMWVNTIKVLQEWIRQCQFSGNINKRSIPGIATTYLKLAGLPPPIAKGLVNDICDGVDANKSNSYSLILKRYEEIGVEIQSFPIMPMHMNFLCIEKSLILKTLIIVNRRDREQNKFWFCLTESMQASQNAISSISISWCKSMSFSGKDDRSIGTAGWQSEHYVAFTRLSLFHFGPIDEGLDIPDAKFEAIQQFKRVRALWFCLVLSILTFTDVPSTRINHYVKLFLSSCRRLWQSTGVELTDYESTDPVITGDDGHVGSKKRKKNQKTTTPSKRSGTKSTETKKQKEGLPFFASGSNYLSVLNIGAMIDHSGHIRGAWGGIHESYI